MTRKNLELINSLTEILDQNKYLLLEGGFAVGKTYIAKEIAIHLSLPRFNSHGIEAGNGNYDVSVELISVQPSLSYEEFVYGINILPENSGLNYQYEDKIFLKLLREAQHSFENRETKKYVIILDDINRGYIAGLLGEIMMLIEPHGDDCYTVTTRNGDKIYLPPNFYIIATRNSVLNQTEQDTYALSRRFYLYTIYSDYRYMDDNANPQALSPYVFSANTIFNRAKKIVDDYLSHSYRSAPGQVNKYVLGHGLFQDNYLSYRLKYQIIPILNEYVKEGILERTAISHIEFLKTLVESDYIKDCSVNEIGISDYSSDVTPDSFIAEDGTHKPLINLISRIIEQGLLSESEILSELLQNPNILVRKKATYAGQEIEYNPEGYLIVKRQDLRGYKYGTASSTRYLYSRSDGIKIGGIEYAFAAEMQPKEYTVWSETFLDADYRNEKNSTSPNTILFLIIKNYYKLLIEKYARYNELWPQDANVQNLRLFAQEDWNNFLESYKSIHPGSAETGNEKGEKNKEANGKVRKIISDLRFLWGSRGSMIEWAGVQLLLEGVYKVNSIEMYRECLTAVRRLNVHQMILQGPPGTSKTYSAKEMLKFAGKGVENDEMLTEEELSNLQIICYDTVNTDNICQFHITHPTEIIPLCWDIVQFHPSYGYEDFVRGIEVSTVPTGDNTSEISYETVDKVLGKMAKLAGAMPDTKFYLLVDEINRANLATVFGELIYGLEYRGESVTTPYEVGDSSKIVLPDNLYIVGTMNTADKSIGSIDYAIRRRFLFFSLLPNKNIIKNYRLDGLEGDDKAAQVEINYKAVKVFNEISRLFNDDNLNNEYYKEDIQIGHTYFLVKSQEELLLRFKYQILPILREYYKDGMFQFEPSDGDDYRSRLFRCISGEISLSNNDQTIEGIFNDIITAGENETETVQNIN